MTAAPNRLKAALSRGDVQMGLWLALANPATAATAVDAGYDWCLIDADHDEGSVRASLAQLRAVTVNGTCAVVRVAATQRDVVQRVVGLGAQTLLVSGVETAAVAQTVAALCHRAADRAGQGSNQICLLVLVDTVAGLDNIGDIASQSGVDGVLIDPPTLSADMGYLGQPETPAVVRAINRGISAIKGAGKAAGAVSFKTDPLRRYAELGVTFMAVGGDATTYASAVRDRVRAANRTAPHTGPSRSRT